MKGFAELLGQLTALLDSESITLQGASQRMAEYIQGQMGCSRVSVWLLEGGLGEPVMRRLAGFDGVTRSFLKEVVTYCDAEFSDYFDKLTSNGVYVCPDTLLDERLGVLRDSYLKPNNIRAAMYATVGTNGTISALLCCSQQGTPRHWTPYEVRALKTYADAISLRRARRKRREADAASLAHRMLHPPGMPGDALPP